MAAYRAPLRTRTRTRHRTVPGLQHLMTAILPVITKTNSRTISNPRRVMEMLLETVEALHADADMTTTMTPANTMRAALANSSPGQPSFVSSQRIPSIPAVHGGTEQVHAVTTKKD